MASRAFIPGLLVPNPILFPELSIPWEGEVRFYGINALSQGVKLLHFLPKVVQIQTVACPVLSILKLPREKKKQRKTAFGIPRYSSHSVRRLSTLRNGSGVGLWNINMATIHIPSHFIPIGGKTASFQTVHTSLSLEILQQLTTNFPCSSAWIFLCWKEDIKSQCIIYSSYLRHYIFTIIERWK